MLNILSNVLCSKTVPIIIQVIHFSLAENGCFVGINLSLSKFKLDMLSILMCFLVFTPECCKKAHTVGL